MKRNPAYFLFAILGIALAILSIVFGSVLPLMKARSFITASRALPNIESVVDMKAILDPMFALYSPVGDEELIKFTANSLFGVVTDPKQSEQVSLAVLTYLEPRAHKENIRHIIIFARMYLSLYENYRKVEYLNAAEAYYLRAHEIAPRLPQPLYALFEISREKRDEARVTEFGEKILSLWPQETRIQRVGD